MEDYRSGTVVDVVSEGTIVTVMVRLEGNGPYAVYFDHRPFCHMIEDLCITLDELIGQYVEIIHDDDGQYMCFPYGLLVDEP